jgi:hypothetical protein
MVSVFLQAYLARGQLEIAQHAGRYAVQPQLHDVGITTAAHEFGRRQCVSLKDKSIGRYRTPSPFIQEILGRSCSEATEYLKMP